LILGIIKIPDIKIISNGGPVKGVLAIFAKSVIVHRGHGDGPGNR
jgi:hypothetical protein